MQERSSIQRYTGLLARIASDVVLAQAHAWICRQRREYSPNSDVWDLRWRWDEVRPWLQRKLLAGTFRFGAVRHRCIRGELIELWSAEDAIVLKALALVLTEEWAPRLSPRCHHLPGNGGVKGALREVRDGIPGHRFVFRTDVKDLKTSVGRVER